MLTKQEGNDTNNNANSSNNNIMSQKSVRQVASEVSQLLSMFCQNVQDTEAEEELSKCLPHFQCILSEMSQLVLISQKHQEEHKVTNDDLDWDYTQDMVVYPEEFSIISSSLSWSDLSSDLSSDSNSTYIDPEVEERVLLQEIFVDGMVDAIDRIAPALCSILGSQSGRGGSK